MKKLFLIAFVGILGLFAPVHIVSSALDYPLKRGETILTQENKDVIGQEITDSDDVLRDGTEAIGEGIGDAAGSEKIFYEEITDTSEAWTELTRTWKGIVNWTLGIAGLIVLIYLIYHGLLVATAGGDEEKIKKGRTGVKNALFAILGIALAWFIISVVFWLINKLTQ